MNGNIDRVGSVSTSAANSRKGGLTSLAMIAAAGAAASVGSVASGQTWVGPVSGNWSAAGNWSGGVPVSGPTASLIFRNRAGAPVSATNDIGVFILNSLANNTNTVGGFLIPATNSLTFDGTTPAIVHNGRGAFTISSSVLLNATMAISGSGSGTLSMNGVLSGAGGLTIGTTPGLVNTGMVVLGGANTFTGGVTLNSGNLRISSTGALGTGAFTVGGSSVLDVGGTVTPTASSYAINGDLRITGSSGLTLSNAITGAGAMTLNTTSAVTVTSNSTGYSGVVNVERAVVPAVSAAPAGMTLSGVNGAMINVPTWNIRGGALNLSNASGAVNSNRIGDAAAINLGSGSLTVNTNSAVVNEVVGAISGSGYNTIGMTVSAGTSPVQISASSLSRTDRGTFLIRGSSLGTGASISGGNGYLTLGTGPTLVGGGGAAGTTTISILPWAVGDTSGSGTGTSFVTYGATTGFRPLNITTEYAANLTSGATTNARLTASTANAASVTVNSLVLAGSGAVTGAGTLNITSGAILNTNSTATIANTIAFPTGVEGLIFSPSAMTISGAMTGDNGLTRSGSGTLTLSGNNSGLTGTFTINDGAVSFASANNLPGTGDIVLSGRGSGSTALNYSATTPITISRGLVINNGWMSLGTSSTLGGDVTYSGVISGNGGVFAGSSSSASRIILTGANTFTGPTRINEGQIVISGDSSLGNGGGVDFFSGNSAMGSSIEGIAMTGNWTTSRNISFNSSGGIDTGAFNASWGGPVTGSGTMSKIGSGELRITGSGNTFSGPIALSAGSLVLSGAGQLPNASTVTIGSGATFAIDETAGAQQDRVGASTGITLNANNSLLLLTAPVAGGANLQFGALSLTPGSNTSTVQIVDGGAGNNTYSFLSLNSVTAGNTLRFIGTTNLGLTSPGGSRILFNTAPTLVGGVIPNVSFSGFGGSLVSATYDPVLGLLAYLQTTGTFIDNFNNVGTGSITANNTNFLSTGAVTANLGAGVNSLTLAGHNLTLVPNVYATPSVTNRNAAADSLILGNGNLVLTTASAAISGAGRIQFGDSGTTQAIIDVASGQTLTVNAGSTLATTGGLNKTSAGILTINGTNSITGAYNIAAGTANLNTGGTTSGLTSAASTTLGLGASTLTVNGAATTIAAGLLTGSTGSSITLAAANTGTLTLSGANGAGLVTSFAVNGGALVAGNATALGAATNAVTVGSGGTLGFSGSVTVANANPVTINGTGATGRNGAIDNISGANSFAGPITLASNATIGATTGTLTLSGGLSGTGQPTFNVAGGAQVTLSTVALNVGTNALSKTGAGVLVLPNLANTMGGQNISGGTVQASADNNLGANTGTMNLSNGGGFRYGAAFALDAARPIVLGTGGGSFDTNTFSPTYSGSMTGVGSFTKTGTGTLTLGATQSYSGATIVTNGTLSQSVANTLPSGTVLTIGDTGASAAGGILNLNGQNLTVAGLNVVAPSGSTTRVSGTGTLTVNGPISYVNNTVDPNNDFPVTVGVAGTVLDLGGSTRNVSVVANANTNDLIFTAVIQNGGINYTGTSTNTSAAAMQLNAANTFNGGLTVNSGVVNVSTTGTLGAATNAVSIFATGTAGVGTNSTINLGSNQTIGSLTGGTVSGTAVATMAMGSFGLTVNQGTNTTFGGLITGAGAFAKGGAGTLNLTGNSTHTGSITVNAGNLAINGNYAGVAAGTVTVNSGGTLSGSGTLGSSSTLVRNTTINAGGNLSPGNSPGILTINGNVNFAADSNFNLEINGFNVGTEYDRLVVNGTVTNAGNINVAFDSWAAPYVPYTGNDADPYLNDTWFILSNDGTDATAAFANAAEGATISVGTVGGIAHTAQITYFADLATGSLTGGNDVALYNLIPTPSATALIGLGTILAGRRRRQA